MATAAPAIMTTLPQGPYEIKPEIATSQIPAITALNPVMTSVHRPMTSAPQPMTSTPKLATSPHQPATSSAITLTSNTALVSGGKLRVHTTDSIAYWQQHCPIRRPRLFYHKLTPYNSYMVDKGSAAGSSLNFCKILTFEKSTISAASLIAQKSQLRTKLDQMELWGYDIATLSRDQYNVKSQAIESARHATLLNTAPLENMLRAVNSHFDRKHATLIRTIKDELDIAIEAPASAPVTTNASKSWEAVPNSSSSTLAPLERIPSNTQLYSGYVPADVSVQDERSTILPRAMVAASLFEGQSLMYTDGTSNNSNASTNTLVTSVNLNVNQQPNSQNWYMNNNADVAIVTPDHVTPEQDSGIYVDRHPIDGGNIIHVAEKAYRVFNSLEFSTPLKDSATAVCKAIKLENSHCGGSLPSPISTPGNSVWHSEQSQIGTSLNGSSASSLYCSTPRKSSYPTAALNTNQSLLEAISDAHKQRDVGVSITESSKIKRALNPLATRIMENWYRKNTRHPYPSLDAAEVLANAGGITVEQVKKWFANKRLRNRNTRGKRELARLRRELRKQLDGKAGDGSGGGGGVEYGYLYGEVPTLPPVEGIFGGCASEFGTVNEYHM